MKSTKKSEGFTEEERGAMKERAQELKAAGRRGSRYATLGFRQDAKLDEGTMWPTAFGLAKLTAADEKRIGALVKKAAS